MSAKIYVTVSASGQFAQSVWLDRVRKEAVDYAKNYAREQGWDYDAEDEYPESQATPGSALIYHVQEEADRCEDYISVFEVVIEAPPEFHMVSNIDWICEDTESGEAVASGSFDYWRLDEGADRLVKEINEHVPKHCFKDNVPTPIDPKRERLEGITPVMIHGVPVYFEPISDTQTYGGPSYVIDGAGMHESGSPDPTKWKPTTWKDLKDGWVKWATESEAVKGKAEKLLRVEIGSLGWFSGRIGTRNLNRAHGLILLDTMHALRVVKK